MKKNYTMVFAVVAILIVLCAFWGCDSGSDDDDSNSSPSVIYINNAADWAKIGTSGYPLSGNYTLTADITLPSGWTPIGNGTQPFTGTFDGGGRSITINSFPSAGVDISSAPAFASVGGSTLTARGLFAYTENATIKNLDITVTLGSPFVITSTAADQIQFFGTVAAVAINTAFTNVNFSGGTLDVSASSTDHITLGGIVSVLIEGSSMTNCSMTGNVEVSSGIANNTSIGGLAGSSRGSIINSSVSGNVEVSGGDENEVGGLAGTARGSIINSSVSGNVEVSNSGSENEVGGLAGKTSDGSIINSSVSGNVEVSGGDENEVGGLTGAAQGFMSIVNSSVSGNVRAESSASGSAIVGGLAGAFEIHDEDCLAVIRKSYSTGTVSAISTTGSATSGGIAGTVRENGGTANENVEITDCYSTGNISAGGGTWVYSGGIAGTCDVSNDTITIARCYASGTISATGSSSNKYAGGIAGSAFADSGATGSITGCAALSGVISYEGSATAKRIAGSVTGIGFSLSNNIANSAMTGATWTDKGPHGQDGADVSVPASKSDFETTLDWDFSTVWKWQGGYPVLQWQP